jgi:CDK inhibitor PHO81
VTLEIGGDVETYWKSTAITPTPITTTSSRHRSDLIGSAHASPSSQTAGQQAGYGSTISSLKGQYLHITVQVTRDLHPVVFPDWLLPGTAFNLGVSDVTLTQFQALAVQNGRSLESVTSIPLNESSTLLTRCMMSLTDLLKVFQ